MRRVIVTGRVRVARAGMRPDREATTARGGAAEARARFHRSKLLIAASRLDAGAATWTSRRRSGTLCRRMKSVLWLLFFVALTIATRCHNFADVFVNGHVYFVDADCYSRMTRARMVTENSFAIIRHHDFENWPKGIAPHTTMPLDWIVALGDLKLRIVKCFLAERWRGQTLDLAGALVSPALGVWTVVFLWFWARRLRVRFGGAMLTVVSVSPILVHGTLLGRPDHQSLLIFLLAVAIGAEVLLARESSRAWGIASGTAWGLALWVSQYEPFVLLAAVVIVQLVFFRAKFFARERWPGFIVLAAVLAVAFCIEGWRAQWPDATTRAYFPAWVKSIGELRAVSILSPTLWHWCGFVLIASPFVLAARFRVAREAALLLALLAVCFGLTLTQHRWGYFLSLVFAMSLPWVLPIFRREWIAWILFAGSLWPVASEWDATLFPDETSAAKLAERRGENEQLRDIAGQLAHAPRGGVIAPWWFSPALAYWSGQPCVAGSSHESLAGIVDAARFYLAENPDEAREILRARDVKYVIAYDSTRIVETSAALLGETDTAMPIAKVLYERPHSAPDFLVVNYANRSFKIFVSRE